MTPPSAYRISPVSTADVPAICALAREVWYQHYPGIITVRQIDYMLDQRYRPEIILEQIASGQAWWDKLEIDGRLAGFAQYEPGSKPASMKLDKIYVHSRYRGKGYGSALLAHVEAASRRRGMRTLYLQVNKGNAMSIAVYRRNGFEVAGEIKVDIGGGFCMDDYVMEKAVMSDG
jgi:ribosomal protein S18 acetylase RimI-like enzyme